MSSYSNTLTGEDAQKRDLDGVFTVVIPAVATGSDDFTLIGVAKFAGRLKSVKFFPKTTVTGANTDTRSHSLVNRKGDNTGTTVMATLQYNTGVNAPAKRAKSLTNSATAANLLVAVGDVLEFVSTHIGTGLDDVGGLLEVKIERSI